MTDPLFPPDLEVSVDEVRSHLERGSPAGLVLLDVRQPAEYDAGHLPGAVLVPLGEIEARRRELDPGASIVAYCHVGVRSLAAARYLAGRGFESARSMRGGIEAWRGGVAVGPLAWGFDLVESDASPSRAAGTALAMEEGLGRFYAEIAELPEAEDARALLAELAGLERGHELRVRRLLIDVGGDASDVPDLGDRLEGAFRPKDLTDHAARLADSVPGLLGLAMMVECQAMDLYLRLARRSDDAATREVWTALAGDERSHLRRLGEMLDRSVG